MLAVHDVNKDIFGWHMDDAGVNSKDAVTSDFNGG